MSDLLSYIYQKGINEPSVIFSENNFPTNDLSMLIWLISPVDKSTFRKTNIPDVKTMNNVDWLSHEMLTTFVEFSKS